jgi:hypothetical protein
MTRLLFTPLDEEYCGVDEIRTNTTDNEVGLDRRWRGAEKEDEVGRYEWHPPRERRTKPSYPKNYYNFKTGRRNNKMSFLSPFHHFFYHPHM